MCSIGLTRAYNIPIVPRPDRNEKDIKVIQDFIEGKVIAPTSRHRKAIRLLSVALAGIQAYTAIPIAKVAAAGATSMAASTKVVALGAVAVGAVMADPVVPKEVDDILLKIQLICLGTCVGVGVIFAMISGFFRIIGLREEARKRYEDAIMGVIQVLTAPAVLGIIALIVRGVLKLFPGSNV